MGRGVEELSSRSARGDVITVRVNFFLTGKRVARNEELLVGVDEGSTVDQVLRVLKLPKWELDLLFATDGAVREGIVVLLNGQNIEFREGLETCVRQSDVVSILRILAGG